MGLWIDALQPHGDALPSLVFGILIDPKIRTSEQAKNTIFYRRANLGRRIGRLIIVPSIKFLPKNIQKKFGRKVRLCTYSHGSIKSKEPRPALCMKASRSVVPIYVERAVFRAGLAK